MSSFCPIASVEGSVSYGFCYMVRLNLFTSCQISNGSCHFQYSVIGSG